MSVYFVDCVCSFYVWPVLNCVSVTIEFSVWSIVMIVERVTLEIECICLFVCVCESVKISCPWTWIFKHTYGSTLGCIIIVHYLSRWCCLHISSIFHFLFPLGWFVPPSVPPPHTRLHPNFVNIYVFHCIFIWSPARIMASNKWTVSVPLVAYETPRSSRWRVAERFPSWSISNRDTDVVYTPLVCPQCLGSWTLSYR